jgi:hypothetical protein
MLRISVIPILMGGMLSNVVVRLLNGQQQMAGKDYKIQIAEDKDELARILKSKDSVRESGWACRATEAPPYICDPGS